MTTTTPTRRPITRRLSNGPAITVTRFSLSPPDDDAVAALPERVAELHRRLGDLERQTNEATAAVWTTSEAIAAAEKLDDEALGAALLAGGKDPGPVHANAARAEHADAKRRHRGFEEALQATRVELFDALRAAHLADTLDALEERAEALRLSAEDALDRLTPIFDEYRAVRGFAEGLAAFPSRHAPMDYDRQGLTRGVGMIRQQFAAVAPEYADVHARGES